MNSNYLFLKKTVHAAKNSSSGYVEVGQLPASEDCSQATVDCVTCMHSFRHISLNCHGTTTQPAYGTFKTLQLKLSKTCPMNIHKCEGTSPICSSFPWFCPCALPYLRFYFTRHSALTSRTLSCHCHAVFYLTKTHLIPLGQKFQIRLLPVLPQTI